MPREFVTPIVVVDVAVGVGGKVLVIAGINLGAGLVRATWTTGSRRRRPGGLHDRWVTRMADSYGGRIIGVGWCLGVRVRLSAAREVAFGY